MKRFIHIITVLLGAVVGLSLNSCIYDKIAEEQVADQLRGDEMQFILKINAVGADTAQPTDMVETVNSLRVIMIDENGRLNVNERITLPGYAAKTFSYIYVRSLNAGKKRIFLVANEDSVGEVKLTDNTGVPSGMKLTSLREMLNFFKADSPDDETAATGNTFADVLNRVYFKNDYAKMTTGNKIALPYTAYYELEMDNMMDNPLMKVEQVMYLVPVAAKFDFVITNYRKYEAYLYDIGISRVNNHNYLNAQLDDSEKFRPRPSAAASGSDSGVGAGSGTDTGSGSEKLWWIDWLEECALGSSAMDSEDALAGYNGRWGWISKYYMPLPNEPMTELYLNPTTGQQTKLCTLAGLVDKNNPSRATLGPFYVPESLNRDINSVTGQSYSLTFVVGDSSEPGIIHTLPGNVIDTLGALFRDTHVIIYVDFYESKADIYAEVVDWVYVPFLGYVWQDEDYDGNYTEDSDEEPED